MDPSPTKLLVSTALQQSATFFCTRSSRDKLASYSPLLDDLKIYRFIGYLSVYALQKPRLGYLVVNV